MHVRSSDHVRCFAASPHVNVISVNADAVAQRHGIDTRYLVGCSERAERFLGELRALLREQFPPATLPGVDLVVCGSIAKRQCTKGSDVDFFGYSEGSLAAERTQPMLEAMLAKARADGYDAPFTGGPNAVFVQSSELETFDLLKDRNPQVFRRMMLLTASVSVYDPELRAKVIRNLLSAYVGRDRQPRVRGVVDHLMQVARIGNHTIEMRLGDRTNPDGGLMQWAKAHTLYRIELAGSLAAMIRADRLAAGRSRDELIEALATQLDQPAFDRLLVWYDDVSADGQRALASLLLVANETLTLLGTDGVRTRLRDVADDAPTRELRAAFEGHMATVQQALVQLFFRESVFRPWTEELGLFG